MPSLFPALLPVCLLLAITFVSQTAQAVESPGLTSRLNEEQQKIQRLKKGIESQKTKVQTTIKQENSILHELEKVQQDIRGEELKLNALKVELNKNEQLSKARESETAQAKIAKEQTQQHVKKRLQALYRLGDTGFINAAFSSRKFPDFLIFHEYFAAMRTRDMASIRDYRQKVANLEKASTELKQQQLALNENIGAIKKQENQLNASREERIRLLEKVRTEKKLYQLALAELESAADRLNSTIEKLKREAAKKQSPEIRHKENTPAADGKTKSELSGFTAQKGRLLPPVSGTIITAFGKNTQNKFGIATFASGIDIKTPPGAKITAIYEGRVIYAKFLRGYGNLLIIDHGQQYLSLVARAERFFKEEGDNVSKGEMIGIMSNKEEQLGDGLHFEIRKGTKPEDPLPWLNRAKLTFGAETH